MREIYKEEKALLEQARAFFTDPDHLEETALVQERAKHIKELLDKIKPWRKLKLSAYAKRIIIAVGIYLILMLPVGLFFFSDYQQDSGLVNYSEGVGERIETQYVPITTVNVAAGSFLKRTARYTPREIESNPGGGIDAGMTVAILPAEENGKVTALWTAPRDGKRVLLRRDFNEKLNDDEETFVVIDDVDIAAASAVQKADGSYIVAGAITEPVQRIFVQYFSPEWKQIGERITVLADETNEFVDGIQVSIWGTRVVVLTSLIPPENSSILLRRQPMMRLFEADLELVYEAPVQVGTIHTDRFARFVSWREPNRFLIIASGRPAVNDGGGERGNELYALQFTNEGSPVEYFKLTNNGRPHDFWTSSSWFDEKKGFTYITNHRIPAPSFNDVDFPVSYPEHTGKAFVHVLDKNLDMLGTVTIQEEETGQGKASAPTRTRIFKIDQKIYTLFDLITKNKNPENDEITTDRAVMVSRVDVNL